VNLYDVLFAFNLVSNHLQDVQRLSNFGLRRYRPISFCRSASLLIRFFFCSMNHNQAKPMAKITITIKMAYSIIGAVPS
jgi:hypothetical protein